MPALKGAGLLKGLGVTFKTMSRRSATAQYPHVRPDLPARTRGVIALVEENCTVCMLCSRECPDWCIYIDSHKETVAPKEGGRARTRNILDRFAIDFALCMYCGICVEVCPFDALFWSPEFEYAEYSHEPLTHEKDRLREWAYTVPAGDRRRALGRAGWSRWGAGRRGGASQAARRPRRARHRPGDLRPAGRGGRVRADRQGQGQGRLHAQGQGRGAGEACRRAERGRGMSGQEIAFLILAIIGGIGGLLVVTSRNIVHAALYLVVALASVAGIYLLLAAPFVAFVQVIIYVGAIVVLLLFGIMLTRAPVGRRVLDNTIRARVGALVVAAGFFAMLTYFLVRAFGGDRIANRAATATAALGNSLFRNFVLPFEAVSVLLLAALVGAIVLARRD